MGTLHNWKVVGSFSIRFCLKKKFCANLKIPNISHNIKESLYQILELYVL